MKKIPQRDIIVELARRQGEFRASELLRKVDVTRQYLSRILSELVASGELVKIGSTRGARYASPEKARSGVFDVKFQRKLRNVQLEEHVVLQDIERSLAGYNAISEDVRNIFVYAFSEMLNNAIEHSKSKDIVVTIGLHDGALSFTVDDFGVGVFRNIMSKRRLTSEIEAIQDLLKGKTTTAPRAHSGEGIFFTSKVADTFILDSYGQQLIVDNLRHDLAVGETRGRPKQGTRVTFTIALRSSRHLNDVFREYTADVDASGVPAFNKTEITVRLYQTGGVFVSRSQARRVLSGLEKFRVVVLDFDRVPMVGQAFADEIFRVFRLKHPHVEIRIDHANPSVKFMIERVERPGDR